ncbi:hypothetical protein ACIQCG_00840 [Streptomyces noursei]|uniref:hypothetical protein n=1 Tax=Streptomyces noursei TaxID=1971 RepID=UPI0023B7938E|nr:hypothetical protein [Streptomyces noursei]
MAMSEAKILERMQARQKEREEAFLPLARMMARREELRRQLADTDEPYGALYDGALAASWGPEELEDLGAETPEVPTKRPKGRPRKHAAGRPRKRAAHDHEPAGPVHARPASRPDDEEQHVQPATAGAVPAPGGLAGMRPEGG